MKKYILSACVVVSFILYSFAMRHDDTPVVVQPSSTPATPSNSTSTNSSRYKDGTYVGSAADAFYGNIQVEAIIKGGKLTDVQFLQHPSDRPNSIEINNQAMPLLQQEALKAQSAHVDIVSGATDTSQAFVQSLSAALTKAIS